MASTAVAKLEVFFHQFKRLTYKKHELILRGDDTPSGVYYLSSGYVRFFSISETGQELTLIIFKPQDIFPIRWAVTDNQHTYYFEAMTPVEVYKSTKERFLDFTESNSEISFELLRSVLERLGGLIERMEYAVFGNAYEKTASVLVICAERFGLKNNGKITIKLPLTHKDVANLIGLTRETTSVEIKRLENLGICSKKDGLLIVNDLDILKKEAHWNESI